MEQCKQQGIDIIVDIIIDIIIDKIRKEETKMYELVIFDLDGTLVDTIESIAMAGNKMLEACGYTKREPFEYNYFAGDGHHELIKRALYAAGDTEYSSYEKGVRLYEKYFEKDCTYNVKAYEGIMSLLLTLKKKGIKIAVLTNKAHNRAMNVLDTVFGKDFFDVVLGVHEGLEKKPNPKGAFYITRKLNIDPKKCIYVGDTDVDMQTGHAAGMFTIGVLWGFRDREELEKYNPQAIISKPEEILDVL